MAIWSGILSGVAGLIKGGGDAIVNVKDAFGGHKGREKTQSHAYDLGVLAEFANESNRENKTWWDSWWDGLNRAPRPLFVFSIFYYFVIAVIDPIGFQSLNIRLAAVPTPMWGIIGGIITFYFGGRMHLYKMKSLPMSDAMFKTYLENLDKIEAIKEKRKLAKEKKEKEEAELKAKEETE